MCGDYDSVIGMDKLEPITRFVTGMSKGRFAPAEGAATLCGVYRRDRRRHRPRAPRACRCGSAAGSPRPGPADMPAASAASARSLALGAAWGLTLPLLRDRGLDRLPAASG